MTWPVLPLGDVAETALGKMLDKGKPKGFTHVAYLRNVNVQWGRIDTHDLLMMELADDQRERFAVGEGDLLVCEGGEVGRCAIWHGRKEYLAYQKALHRIRPNDALDARYLRYLLEHHSLSGILAGLATGSTIAHLPQQQLRRVPVPMAPLDEQHRIVDLLDDHLSRLDAATKGLHGAIARCNALLTTGLWLATHGLEGAKAVELHSIADVRLGRQRSPKNHTGDRMRPYLRAANVDWDTLRLGDVKEMQFTEAEETSYRLDPGDILLTEASGSPAEVGKSVIYAGEPANVCFQNTLLRVRCHSADPKFVQRYLLAEARAGRFMPDARGVGINHLGRARLAGLPIELPDPDAQARAVAECRDLVDGVERLRSVVRCQLTRSGALRRALLASAFAGRLTGAAPDLSAVGEMIGA